MSDLQSVAAKIISEILSSRSPELGARLKQLLKKAFVENGLGEFDEKALGFQKFTDYLRHEHGNLVEIVKPDGSGDVNVVLRSAYDAAENHATHEFNIKSDVWQAFVNPDPQRRRFFRKENGDVLHFLVNENSTEEQEVESNHSQYIEITPISGEEQIEWMREFLAGLGLADDERSSLESIVTGSYSAAMNAVFVRSLGRYSVAWKKFRASHINKAIKNWALISGVDFSMLHEKARTKSFVEHHSSPSRLIQGITPKQQAIRLFELLSEEDVSRSVLPILLSVILIKSRP